ncbi:max-binding protein MNT [Xiphophorus hellerii]|uniref:max-binding protein MNT n=1 Tax=Xiphophorus hellerii TaxID=8084 RepID=UPI0013B3F405|nr:max-binding protein MNT [Xiphophorus hellerii]
MSIETLLEAAKFLELQAQQQQKAREDEVKAKLLLQQKTEYIYPDVTYNSTPHINNVPKAEERLTECRPPPIPPSLPPSSMPVTVFPIPVVTPNPTGSPSLPVTTLSPPAAPSLAFPNRDPQSPQEQSAAGMRCSPPLKADYPTPAVTVNHRQPIQNHHNLSLLIDQNTQVQQPTPTQQVVQCYAGSIISAPQHQALLPHPSPLLQPTPPQNGTVSRGSPPDDSRQLDSKKRPGGAGTREVHNKLEKNRRAHLKECFETLKKNIPNIDEKKTSNLSVLRSALRYIQTLKRKEKEYEHDMERLAREKIATQQRLAELKNDVSQWMDVVEIDRVLRQTGQPEEDQASTSTASEGEEGMEEDLEEESAQRAPSASPAAPHTMKPELLKLVTQTPAVTPATTASIITQHISTLNKAPLLQPLPLNPVAPPILPAPASSPPSVPAKPVASLHPTVIAHASVSHPSVIQAVNHVLHGGAPKHMTLGPCTTSSSVQLAPSPQPFSHITVHPVAHLGQHIPALYPQPVAVTPPAVVGHIAHPHVNGTSSTQATAAAAIVGKQAAVSTQMMAHHPQLMGQTVLNPVTMVTMPSFPISTLKLA